MNINAPRQVQVKNNEGESYFGRKAFLATSMAISAVAAQVINNQLIAATSKAIMDRVIENDPYHTYKVTTCIALAIETLLLLSYGIYSCCKTKDEVEEDKKLLDVAKLELDEVVEPISFEVNVEIQEEDKKLQDIAKQEVDEVVEQIPLKFDVEIQKEEVQEVKIMPAKSVIKTATIHNIDHKDITIDENKSMRAQLIKKDNVAEVYKELTETVYDILDNLEKEECNLELEKLNTELKDLDQRIIALEAKRNEENSNNEDDDIDTSPKAFIERLKDSSTEKEVDEKFRARFTDKNELILLLRNDRISIVSEGILSLLPLETLQTFYIKKINAMHVQPGLKSAKTKANDLEQQMATISDTKDLDELIASLDK